MSLKKLWGLLASGALVGAVAMAGGCSSSSSNTTPTSDAGEGGIIHKDSGTGDDAAGDDGSTAQAFDGTSGKTCTSDADCKGTGPNAPGQNKCSSDYAFKITNIQVSLWPQPICLMPLPTTAGGGNCDPAPPTDPTGQFIHFCDGPDDPSAPGICLANNPQAPVSGQGICLPKCSFKTDGSAATGCPGKDTCAPYTYTLDPMTNTVTGYGFCQGSCVQDSDCATLGATFKCQQDLGFCTKTPVTRAADAGGALGDSCTMTTGNNGLCNCEYNTTTNNGFCTSACVVGSKAYNGADCPNGWVCDNFTSKSLDFGDAGMFNVTAQNVGTAGVCFQSCTAVDASTGCVPNTTCQAGTVVGPDCLP